jgi:hypothetical protein
MHNIILLESYSIWCESTVLFNTESYSNCPVQRLKSGTHGCPIITDQNLATQIILHKIDDPDSFLFL